MPTTPTRKIAVVGLGYVGLPVAVALARQFPSTIGFDVDAQKVARLANGEDPNGEIPRELLMASGLQVSSDEADLQSPDFYVVAVPTPIDVSKRPDLGALESASRLVGRHINRGDIVVYESTVYPGVTEDFCGPILARESGLDCGRDFSLAYSPERINPGDPEHRFETIVKVVSGQDEATLDTVASVYGAVVEAGVHRAKSIKVAEASKVIENIQRDLNIALMNELAIIFDRLGLDTHEVLSASRTKWNFLPFSPGLVGGHCIGVDPYYLTTKAEEIGIHPQVILAGRRINDSMGEFVAQRTIREMILAGRQVLGGRVGILGIAFKENVSDLRNSRVPQIVAELTRHGATVLVHDPLADRSGASEEYGIDLVDAAALGNLDALIYAVPHREMESLAQALASRTPVVVDVRSRLDDVQLMPGGRLWRL